MVGAGPTGITAATLLAQYGIGCLVLDRYATAYPQPRAVHLDDEVHRIIARLGVGAEFAAISRPAMGLRLLDRDFRLLAQFQRDAGASIHGYPQANMFDQPELEALLRANLANYPNAQLRGDVDVTNVSQSDPGCVTVEFTDRSTGEQHLVEARYVLGCDGANSITRASIGSAMKDLGFEQRWLVADVATEAELNQWDGVHQVCNPVRAATYMRIGPTRYRWEFRLLSGESADDYRTLTALRQLIEPWVEGIDDRRLQVLRIAEYTFRAQLADRWRDRNVLLLGDAVHLTPPFIGQGMGSGLRDAMNLAWKLAAVIGDDLPAGSLDTYEAERKPHVRMMIRLALGMGWAMTAGGRLGNLIRRLLVPRLYLIPGVRTRLLNSNTPPLRSSALILKPRRPHGLSGSLCPNPVVSDAVRLDTLLGNGFGLITAKPLDQPRREELRLRGTTVVIAQPGSELARWLRSGRALAAVVRPDRTVMQSGRRLRPLCNAIPRLTAAVEPARPAPLAVTEKI
ncbi:bifunctional 3-(3-hydroxy-phenyl)propionate/3-hydroxycinnamic acid hydroxylase [Mycobacterium cookii]|uniref:3-(3-hydroxyphenyl)propionate hydroxylase n=1 Tax=Mycobacterium cookii TaxID=1775 RepID=A0A7I7L2P8_9MYCO|nr:3-(3-hydroxyphenyl)propionate hydroxylase [Mycobacterium cookii]